MKNTIYAIIISFSILGCASSKKKTESATKSDEKKEVAADSVVVKTADVKTATETKKETTADKTKTVVTYKPVIDATTGKAKPFNMTTKKDGKTSSSVDINGEGEVVITNESESLKEESSHKSDSIASVNENYKKELKELAVKSSIFEETVKTTKSTVFTLWLIIIILSLCLIISLYFNFK